MQKNAKSAKNGLFEYACTPFYEKYRRYGLVIS